MPRLSTKVKVYPAHRESLGAQAERVPGAHGRRPGQPVQCLVAAV